MMKEWIKKWCGDRRVMCGLWVLIGVISALTKLSPTRHNNYDIFRYVFYNTWEGASLYAPSTDGGFWDTNHYGPFFSVVIAPFAVMPTWLGLTLWCTLLSVFLFWAVSRYCSLPAGVSKSGVSEGTAVTSKVTNVALPFIIWYCAHELLTALFMQQFNVAIAAIILLSYYFVEKERDEYATLFIVIGTLVKLYGIVGLAFFFFSKHKMRFVLTLVGWGVVLFCLPMLISSPEYQIGQYHEWYLSITEKNGENADSIAQNISLLGLVHRTTGCWFSDLWLIIPGMVVMAVGYFRIGQWQNVRFRQTVLAAVMMFVCLFSTGTESSGYIIALTGCAIWYCAAPWQRTRWDVALMVFAFILTSLSPSDLFPRFIKEQWVQPYALKALPVVLIWCKLSYELIFKDYYCKNNAD